MSLTVIRKPRCWRKYVVYDLEWVPGTLDVRLVGIYDGERYKCYRSVESFISNELTDKNRGKWFYAHAGGLADFQFILEQFLKDKSKYRIRASFSGSSAIIVHVTRGKNSWHFVDSYWLLKDKLRNIGPWVGMQKGGIDDEESEEELTEEQEKERERKIVDFYTNTPISELRDYNEQDCIILYRAIEFFENTLIDLGGQLKMTQASCAMELFRRRFLKADIDTSVFINNIARNAYFASRVEVLTRHCDEAEYYDVNSSFPYAMTFPCPGEFTGSSETLPEGDEIYIADVEIDVPESYLPPMPTRLGGRLFFPFGRWRGWLTNIDVQLVQSTGGRIRRVHESLSFAPFEDLRNYSLTLFELRKKSEGFPKLAYKYLLNSLYGKFAESEWKSGMVINPPVVQEGWNMLFPGVFITETQVPIPHMHVPISAHITAIARRTLYNFMSMSSELHYCDTDGFSTTNSYSSSKELGGLKLEKTIREGEFITQKVYRLHGTDEKGELNKRGVKAKGFSRMTIARFEQLQEDIAIDYTRMIRIKENMRNGESKPSEKVFKKKLKKDTIPKRFFYPDGHSRPWHIDEITEQIG